MTTQVSVIIPAYNRESTIREAVQSVLNQTFRDFELLVVDDCSTDGTVRVLKEIEDPRVRIISCSQNRGACAARNIGIEQAVGQFIAFHDSDDFWHEDRLEKTMSALEESHADFVFSARDLFAHRGDQEPIDQIPLYDLNLKEDKTDALLVWNCVSTQTITAKRSVFDTVRFDPAFPRFQDWDLALQVALNGFCMYYVKESLVDCLYTENSISRDFEKAVYAFRLLEQKYQNEYQKRENTHLAFLRQAAAVLESMGGNGIEFFEKGWKLKHLPSDGLRCLLAKTRLYYPLTKRITGK